VEAWAARCACHAAITSRLHRTSCTRSSSVRCRGLAIIAPSGAVAVLFAGEDNRAWLRSLRLAATLDDLVRLQALQAEFLAVAEASQAEADVLVAKRY